MTTCALNLWLNKFSSCKLWHNVAQSTPEFWFLQQTFNFVTCVKNCHTSHRVIGRFTRTKSAGKMLSSRAHLGQLFLRCGTFQDFGHQYLVKDTTFFSEIDKGEMWKENWSARKGYRYRRVTVRFSVVSKSKEGRIKVCDETSTPLFKWCVTRSRTGTNALTVLVCWKAATFSFLQTGNPIFFPFISGYSVVH